MQLETNNRGNINPVVVGAPQQEPYWKMFLRRLLVMNVGLLIMALGFLGVVRANMGASPWDVLHVGLTYHFPISLGTASILTGMVILLFACWLARSWPTFGVVNNILMCGLFVNWFYDYIPSPDPYWLRGLQFGISMLIAGWGVGIYIASRLGAGPRDWLMLSIHQKTGWAIRWVRTMLEVSAVTAGILLGGPFSVGTIIFSLTFGHPCEWGIKWAERTLSRYVERREYHNEAVN